MYQNNESISSRLNQYPYPQNKIPREIHGPCGGHKFSGIFIRNNFGNNVCENKELYDDKVGNELFLKFKRAANIAVKSLRYINRNEEAVIDVEKEANADGVGFVAKRCENGEMGVEVEKMCGYLENGDSLVSSVQNRLARVHIDDYVEKLDEKGVSEDLLQKAFAPLTYEEKDEVYQALLPRNRTVLVTHQSSNIEITSEVLKCLKLGQWLNDKVINVYLELLKEREKQEPEKFLKCHFFNTFFYKKLIGGKSGYDYKSVRRWTTQKKLGYNLVECDKIFIPIHKEAHWCLAVINNKDKKFHYLDSLRGIDAKVFRVLVCLDVNIFPFDIPSNSSIRECSSFHVSETLGYVLRDEVKDKSGVEIDVDSWIQEHDSNIPGQKNGWDCGMFMIKYVDFYSMGSELFFSQNINIKYSLPVAGRYAIFSLQNSEGNSETESVVKLTPFVDDVLICAHEETTIQGFLVRNNSETELLGICLDIVNKA